MSSFIPTITLSVSPPISFTIQPFLLNIFRRLDDFRVQLHLRLAESLVRSKDVSHLSVERRTARLKSLDALNSYWKRGVFPQNIDFTHKRMPYFVDHRGVHCAMAYLVKESGRDDLVQMVKETHNNVFVKNIHSGPVLDWLPSMGLTKDEAALIQPTYGPCGFGGSRCTPPELVVWIVGVGAFILLEVLSYGVSYWLVAGNSARRRIIAFLYFAMTNALLALMIALLLYPIWRIFAITW